jgi:hypothetical protein
MALVVRKYDGILSPTNLFIQPSLTLLSLSPLPTELMGPLFQWVVPTLLRRGKLCM